MRNLIIHREVKGFNDGPYRFASARIYVGNQTVDIGPDDGKDTVIPVESQLESPRISARLCALDRNDLNRCFFTVEMWGPLPTDDDVHVEFWVQGPCICFQLVAI